MSLRAVYVDLDGTLLGRDGSLLHGADGQFSLLAVRGLEACWRADVEVVIKSGRRLEQVAYLARLIGQRSYICEVGALLVDQGEQVWLSGDLQPTSERNIFEQIADTGAPQLLLERYAGKLEHHEPWHIDRDVSHLFRGEIDLDEANALLAERGHGQLKLIDNGATGRRSDELEVDKPRIYHLLPREVSKVRAVKAHMRRRNYSPGECIAIGDSREDLAVGDVVGRFFLVSNALQDEPELAQRVASMANVEVTEGRMGEGFYEAVVRSLAEGR